MSVEDSDHAYYETVASRVAEKQAVRSYIALTDFAFRHCVESFQGGVLTAKEKQCISTITKKWLNHASRASLRFAEQQHDYVAAQLLEAEKRSAQR